MSIMDKNSVGRFTSRVENYVKYRPHYPREIIPFLSEECSMTKQTIIADIGSGPGISSENFIANGNVVYAIEPNDAMRKSAENIFAGKKNFISIKGTAENTTLKNDSMDMIIAGQAFHWFDREKSRSEFKRILKKDGYVILIWNEKTESDEFMKEYYTLIKKYGINYEIVNHANVDFPALEKFFAPDKCSLKIFDHMHTLDYDGLRGRLLSSSYIPLEGTAHEMMIKELDAIFEKHESAGEVNMMYETLLYYGMLNG